MSAQVQNAAGRKRSKRTKPLPNGQLANANRDVEIVRMLALKADSGAADRRTMIATAAYYRAEKRGFEPGHELDDWLAAEEEVANTVPPEKWSTAENVS